MIPASKSIYQMVINLFVSPKTGDGTDLQEIVIQRGTTLMCNKLVQEGS